MMKAKAAEWVGKKERHNLKNKKAISQFELMKSILKSVAGANGHK